MRHRWGIIAALVIVGFGYAAYPFTALYQIHSAVRGGDAPALSRMIDWSSVREGIKEDICDIVLDEPGDIAKKGQLPAFGASFIRGVTGSSVDREITPEKLAGIAQPAAGSNDDASITWAFFSSPSRFLIEVTVTGHAQPVKAEMAFTGFRWKVVRVWIPTTMLVQGHWTA